jgi:hypothetical protein
MRQGDKMLENLENLENQFTGDLEFLGECDDYRNEQSELGADYFDWINELERQSIENQTLQDGFWQK